MDTDRDFLERWLDRHNHKLEFMRTLTGASMLILSMTILTVQGLVLYHTLGFNLEQFTANIIVKIVQQLFGA